MGNSKSCCIFANGSTPRHYRDPDKKSGKSNGHFRRSGSSGSGLAGSGNAQLGLDDANGQVSTNPGQGILQFFKIKLEKTFYLISSLQYHIWYCQEAVYFTFIVSMLSKGKLLSSFSKKPFLSYTRIIIKAFFQ